MPEPVVRRKLPEKRPEVWTAEDPDRHAVVDGSRVLTYGEWNHRADQLADALAGIAPGAGAAAVILHQRFEWFVINLALAKLGWEHIAVPWNETAAARASMVRACGARLVFAEGDDLAELADLLAPHGIRTYDCGPVDRGVPKFAELIVDPAPTARRSRRTASFVKFTSGTTGRPRGVRRLPACSERERSNRAESAKGALAFVGTDVKISYDRHRALLTMPLHHGAGPRGARICHAEGGTCYLLDRYDPVRVLEIIDRERITHWTTVPTMLQRIRDLPEEVLRRYDVSSVRMIAVGSAPSPMALKRWALSYFGPALFEGYGASELGLVTLMPPDGHERRPGSCGRLRPHVSVRVVGPDGQPVPPGEVGELLIRTPLSITDYLGEHAQGESRATADGYFRIGDYGRLDEDGYLYITGRAKDMVVRGGVNIFPAEIEDVLAGHPDVAAAAVIGVPDEEFGEQLAAFCELRPGATVDTERLRGYAAERLAKHKVPRSVAFVAALPRNGIGKVVKNRLREGYWSDTDFIFSLGIEASEAHG